VRRGAAARAVFALALAAACARERPPSAAPPAAPRLGVLSPSAAETLVALGAGASIVAVGDWVRRPPELAATPGLGSFEAPSAERVLELDVDTLITVRSLAGRRELEELERLGVRVVELDTSTFAGTLDSIAALGALVGREDAAAALAATIRARLEAVAARARGAAPRRVLVVVGREPLFVAGPGSHLDELVRLAGGVNVLADLAAPYAEVSLEAVLARGPEIVLDVAEVGAGASRGEPPGEWGRWPRLPAVAAGRVYRVDPSRLSVPGPRLPEMAELVARLVQPERFGAPLESDFAALDGAAR